MKTSPHAADTSRPPPAQGSTQSHITSLPLPPVPLSTAPVSTHTPASVGPRAHPPLKPGPGGTATGSGPERHGATAGVQARRKGQAQVCFYAEGGGWTGGTRADTEATSVTRRKDDGGLDEEGSRGDRERTEVFPAPLHTVASHWPSLTEDSVPGSQSSLPHSWPITPPDHSPGSLRSHSTSTADLHHYIPPRVINQNQTQSQSPSETLNAHPTSPPAFSPPHC